MDRKLIAIYLRVSTANQDLRSQEPDLKAWLRAHGRARQVRWYRDTFSGKTMRRPAMEQLESHVAGGKVRTVVVWRVDCLGRTAAGMLASLEHLDIAGVKFVAVRDGFDSDTPAGRLVRGVLAQVAAYEHEVISERIRAGIARAKADGKTTLRNRYLPAMQIL